MKKTAFILLILITFLLTTTIASARDGRPHYHRPPYHSGIYIGLPGTWISPPVYYRSYYPTYRASPSYGYGYRVWVPWLLGGEMDPIWVEKCLGSRLLSL